MATAKEKVQAEATGLGIEFTPGNTTDEIKAMIAEKGGDSGSAKKGGKLNYYWLKVKSYVNETDTLVAGFYAVKGEIARFKGQPARYVESFGTDIDDVKVHEIAKHFLIKTDDGKGKLRKAEDLLEEMVIEIDTPKA